MTGLIVPPGVVVPRVKLPSGNVTLEDGRILYKTGDVVQGEVAPGVWQESHVWRSKNGMGVIGSMDAAGPHDTLLHVSLSYGNRDPSWSDIRLVKEAFYGRDVDAMMVIPTESDYVNLHSHTFHLWQTPVSWGMQ